MVCIGEKIRQTNNRAEFSQKSRRIEEKKKRDLKKKEDNRRKFVVGGFVIDAFPELLNITPGTTAENEVRFQSLKQVLSMMAATPELIEKLKERASFEIAAKKVLSDFSAKLNTQCVSGHEEKTER